MIEPEDVSQYYELTDQWMRDVCGGKKSSEALDCIASEVGSRIEAVARVVGATAGSSFEGTDGEATQHLTVWHKTLRQRCSDTYVGLREEGLSRQDANRDPALEAINGIRRGVHRAMIHHKRNAEMANRLALLDVQLNV